MAPHLGTLPEQTALLVWFCCERLPIHRGRPANVRNDPVRSFQATQIQVNLFLIGLGDLATNGAQLFLCLFDFLGDSFQREADFGHVVPLTRRIEIFFVGRFGPIPRGVRQTGVSVVEPQHSVKKDC
jgi:hypothetical protein